ncbi:MAG: apolipoprotein N-acyltransferase [Pseudomonadota bacterium]
MSGAFSALPLSARLAFAAMAGAAGALGQAPFDIPAALLIALTVAFWLWRHDPTRPGLLGWAFGAGYFALALSWIVEPFQVDVDRHGWMAPFALALLSGGLALFWAAAFWAARRVFHSPLALVLTWTGAELLRAYVLTGFPWAAPAQVLVEGPASILLALGGPHVATMSMLGLACLLSAGGPSAQVPAFRVAFRTGQGVLLAAAVLAVSLPHARQSAGLSEHTVRIVQPNAAQHLKWRPEMADVFFSRQLALTGAPPASPDDAPDLVVWPETAIPWRLEAAEPALRLIAQAARGTPVALGALRFEGDSLRNSLAVVAVQGEVSAIYDKHHLVPFGEYVPFGSLTSKLGLEALAASMGGFSSGPGPALLELGALGKALPLICYEAVFPHGVNAMPERASFLLQVTNDAWFGTYAGPQQHLAQARMRAIEQGLPMVRSANTGISAMIGPTGRILAQISLGEEGFLDARLPLALPPTLYSRIGDWPAILFIALGYAGCFFQTWREPRAR